MKCQKCNREIDRNEAYLEHSENGAVVSVEHYRCVEVKAVSHNKYNARPTEIDGIRFDSQAEARRYVALKHMEQCGEISRLQIHPRYLLQNGFSRDGKKEPPVHYVADFSYHKDGRVVTEDVKGMRTAVYNLKRRLFLAKYPEIKFVEIT